MANILSVENAVLVSENAELVSENAELVSENAAMASTIAMLQSSVDVGDTEQHTLLEPMHILDQPHFRYKIHRANLHQSGTLSTSWTALTQFQILLSFLFNSLC
jgi:hypothetical protein